MITRNPRFQADGVTVVTSLEEALVAAELVARSDGVDEVVVIGGAEIYRAALPQADRLYFTAIHAVVAGDAVLPAIDWTQWREVSRERHAVQPFDFSFVCYERANGQASVQ